MDILKYNNDLIPNPVGLNNFGNTCYLNSLLQCLLSCSSFNSIFINQNNNNHNNNSQNNSQNNNELFISYKNFLQQILNNNYSSSLSYHVYRNLILGANKRKDTVKFMSENQQDAQEGFLLLIDILNNKALERLFNYRNHIKMKCNLCNNWCLDKYEENLIMIINPEYETDKNIKNINEFLISHVDEIDENHRCDICKKKSSKTKITNLVMIPEILCISVNKYIRKYNTKLPNQLEFLYKSKNKKLIYMLVAQSEHYGSMGGGHYNAIVLRKNQAYLCDDMCVNTTVMGTTLNTYICFYHYFDIVDV